MLVADGEAPPALAQIAIMNALNSKQPKRI